MYFYMATDKGNTFENLGLRQGRDQISSSKGEMYRRKKGQGWERQSETERGFQLSGRAERRSSWTLLGCTLGKNKRQCAQQVTKEILLFKTIEKKNSHKIQTLQKQRMLWNFYFLGLSKVIWTCYNSPGTYSEWGVNAWLNWERVCRRIDWQIYK